MRKKRSLNPRSLQGDTAAYRSKVFNVAGEFELNNSAKVTNTQCHLVSDPPAPHLWFAKGEDDTARADLKDFDFSCGEPSREVSGVW